MQVKLVFEDLGAFVQSFKGKVSLEGLALTTEDFHKEGTVLELTISLSDDLVLINGTAGVLRSLEVTTPAGPACAMILRFIELDEDSRSLIERMEERHAEEGVRPYQLDGDLAAWRDSPPSMMPAAAPGMPRDEHEPSGGPDSADERRPPAEEETPSARPAVETAAAASSEQASAALDSALDQAGPRRSAGDGVQQPEAGGHKTPSAEGRSLLRPALIVLAAILASVVVVAAVMTFFPELLASGTSEDVESMPPPMATAVVRSPVAISSAEIPSPDPPLDRTPADEEPPDEDMTIAANHPAEQPTPAPALAEAIVPAEEPTAEPVQARPASRVEALDWSDEDSATIIIITADGSFRESQLSQFRLDNEPGPRHLLQISGIVASQLSYTTHVNGPRVTTVRAWHHNDKRPPELHVVCDLASTTVTLESLRFDGNQMVIRFSEP